METHRGFLYYGTYAWDDDPVNGFDDCPHGQCGYKGAAHALNWIRRRDSRGVDQPPAHLHLGATGRYSACAATPHHPLQAPAHSELQMQSMEELR